MDEQKPEEKTSPAERLCSEVQLFDLCELDSCRHKSGRFCTNEELLAKFEAIREDDDADTLVYDEDEMEGEDDLDFDELSDDFEDGDYAEED